MILGLECQFSRAFGWALLDEHRKSFVDLGVITQLGAGDPVDPTLGRMRHGDQIARLLAKLPPCDTVVVEQPEVGTFAIGLSWGAVLGVVAVRTGPRLLTIPRERWQREVLPSADGEVDQRELAFRAAEHVLGGHQRAAAALRRVPGELWPAATAASMIALVAALRPARCERIAA